MGDDYDTYLYESIVNGDDYDTYLELVARGGL